MKLRSITPALVFALPVLAPACSSAPLGEIVIAVRTDVAIPKDIDRVHVEVTVAATGAPKFSRDLDELDSKKLLRLPATLGFTTEDPTQAYRIRVSATLGQKEHQTVRILREVVTTVPADRPVMVPVPLEFLCDGTAVPDVDASGNPKRDDNGNLIVKSSCGDGKTCVAGECVTSELAATTFQAYDAAQIFGGGTGQGDGDCFDPGACFDGATLTPVDMGTCQIKAAAGVNVGLLTQGEGMCGETGCFVPLDAESDGGWKTAGDSIALTPAVCDKIKEGTVVGVVTSPAGKSPCAQKKPSLPTCGPRSTAGTWEAPDPAKPSIVASGQVNPVALALTADSVYWIGRGTFDSMGMPVADGTVKLAALGGGQPFVVASGQGSPHDLTINGPKGFVLWTNAAAGEIRWASVGKAADKSALLSGLSGPEGIYSYDPALYWTELGSNSVSTAKLGADPVKNAPTLTAPLAIAAPANGATAPTRIASAGQLTCWTYEATLDTAAGVVACSDGTTTTVVASQQKTPRSLALAIDGAGKGAIYFADFGKRAEGGGVYRVDVAGPGKFAAPVEISKGNAGFMDGEDYPNGLAIDGASVYWTSRTRGAVMRWSNGALKEIATGQSSPGALAAGTDALYWVNEGTPDKPDGAIMKLAK